MSVIADLAIEAPLTQSLLPLPTESLAPAPQRAGAFFCPAVRTPAPRLESALPWRPDVPAQLSPVRHPQPARRTGARPAHRRARDADIPDDLVRLPRRRPRRGAVQHG